MYLLSFVLLVLTFFLSAFSIATLGYAVWQGRDTATCVQRSEFVFKGIILFFVIISAVLLQALASSDFSLVYVASYTDRALDFFYKLTAFWAGQAGSLLFWLIMILIFNASFVTSKRYTTLENTVKTWYWIVLYVFVAFFAFLLCTWNNPFVMQTPPPSDGAGLNPLLQNIAMIIHPPLLLIGYAGFIIPASLAFAYMITGTKDSISWIERTRTQFFFTWSFLSAGILIGGWWAYMELGWGGYWAWDPVENASFIPWLISTAFLHTALIETRTNKLHRTNFFLISLAALSTVFATYLVRGGVVQSVHAFGGGVGAPLLIFVLVALGVTLFVALTNPAKSEDSLNSLLSKEALSVLMGWLLLAAAAVIIIATLWPVISKLFTTASIGLDARFYNDAVLPIFIVVTIILALCNTVSWNGGIHAKKTAFFIVLCALAAIAVAFVSGYKQFTPLIAVGAAIAAIYSSASQMFPIRKHTVGRSIASQCTHIGFAIIVFGIALSGPFKITEEMQLKVGETKTFQNYTVTYDSFEFKTNNQYTYFKAVLRVKDKDTIVGILTPEKRVYEKFQGMSFAEASTIPSFTKELYASLLSISEDNAIFINISIEPFVNWIWIGAFFLSLAPLVGIALQRKRG